MQCSVNFLSSAGRICFKIIDGRQSSWGKFRPIVYLPWLNILLTFTKGKSQGKLVPTSTIKAYGGSRFIILPISNLGSRWKLVVLHTGFFILKERTHCIGFCEVSRNCRDISGERNISFPSGNPPQNVQRPVPNSVITCGSLISVV
jgi:hypothetical protein